VRQHRPDLPQPTAPQELLGALSGTLLTNRALADLDRVGVTPHAVLLLDDHSNTCSNATKVHRPTDSGSTPEFRS